MKRKRKIHGQLENDFADQVVDTICHALQLRKEMLFSGRNDKYVACARQVICYVLIRFFNVTFAQAGKSLNRSRPAVYYNLNEATKHFTVADYIFMEQWHKITPVLPGLKAKILP
ncbi:hypothetical protein [Chitinophaga flava]|uniref:Chromosomal replication initiator DnaA C-terminal domain-containing protein n=1 Tax=Chitinophaga flava TaxID=2259036 RepID=A0A365XQB2_9BACT|nr:hypothetical protein [Chitinophaga flava]RBL88542.1 hypothetical protein DF182_18355 [Chitinophaga flava]